MDGRLDRRRLALVAARFESPHHGERIAALETAGRFLAAAGLSWRELIDGAAKARDEDHGEGRDPLHHLDIIAAQVRDGAEYLAHHPFPGIERGQHLQLRLSPAPGNVFIMNNPFDGGMHLPDIAIGGVGAIVQQYRVGIFVRVMA